MKHLYIILLVILLSPVFASAQSNYKPGYAITLKGDTIKGFINYREWGQNPSSIDFKTNITDQAARKLTTDDIKLFNVIGLELYQKFTGPIGIDNIDPSRISYGKDTTFKVASVFLRVLIGGKNITLLSYIDDVRPHFYTEEAPGYAPKELIYHLYKENDTQTDAIKTKVDNEYVTQLYFLAQKYNVLTPDLQLDLERTKYDADDILKIVSTINGVSKEEFKKVHIHDTRIDLFASLGPDVSMITPFGRYQTSGAKSGTSILPGLSFGVTLSTRADPKFQFRVEGMISGNQYKSIYIYTNSPFVPVKYSFNQLSFAAIPQIIYNIYNAPKAKVFVAFGFALIYDDYYNAKYDLDYAGTKVTNGDLAGKNFFNTFNTPVMFTVGTRVNRNIEIFARYFTATAVSSDYYFQVKFASTQAGLTYFFK